MESNTKRGYLQTLIKYDVFVSRSVESSQPEWPGVDNRCLRQSKLSNYKQNTPGYEPERNSVTPQPTTTTNASHELGPS